MNSELVDICTVVLESDAGNQQKEVPLYPKDDVNVSQYDNVPVYTQNIIDGILKTAEDSGRYFCPVCTLHYPFDFLLQKHLEKNHMEIIQPNISSQFHPCQICGVTFCNINIASKHMIYFHEKVVHELFLEAGARVNVKCLFCLYKVNTKHLKLLSIHTEKKHLLEFYSFIKSKRHHTEACVNIDKQLETKKTPTVHRRSARNILSENKLSPSQKFEFRELREFLDDCKRKYAFINATRLQKKPLKSILKQNNDMTFSFSNNSVVKNDKKSARKSLRFELPSGGTCPENKIINKGLKSRYSIFTRKSNAETKKKEALNPISIDQCQYIKWSDSLQETSTPTKRTNIRKLNSLHFRTIKQISPISKLKPISCSKISGLYKCGKCWKTFSKNDSLVKHVNKHHKKLTWNILQPTFQCGKCSIKFFENVYLQRHCTLQHSAESMLTRTASPRE